MNRRKGSLAVSITKREARALREVAQHLAAHDPGLARQLIGPIPARLHRFLAGWVTAVGIAAGISVAAPLGAVGWLLGAGLTLLALAVTGLTMTALNGRRTR